jgi:D-serine dehydratase
MTIRRALARPLDLASIRDWQVDATVKGFPGTHAPLALSAIGTQGWSIFGGQVPTPVAILKRSALDNNRRWMKRFLEVTRVQIAPHGKTTMCPQLFELQLQDGAWGMTCASVEQLQVYRRFGVRRVLMANQLVGRANIEYVVTALNEDPAFEFYCLIDSAAGLTHLVSEARRHSLRRPISLLVEVGAPQGRTGVWTAEKALALAREVVAHRPFVQLAGLETYERAVAPGDTEEFESRVRALLAETLRAAQLIHEAGLFSDDVPVVLSAGGSDYFDLAAAAIARGDLPRHTLPLLRSGCYLTLDHVDYAGAFARMRERGLPSELDARGLQPALEVWGCVQSVGEDGRAFATLGKRDISYDVDLPVPVAWARPGEGGVRQIDPGTRVTALNDQHAYLTLPHGSPLRVGDLVGFGVSHPCTTFDKWHLIYVVDDDYRIVDAVRTFF